MCLCCHFSCLQPQSARRKSGKVCSLSFGAEVLVGGGGLSKIGTFVVSEGKGREAVQPDLWSLGLRGEMEGRKAFLQPGR